jgi:N utilization substance protein B
MVNSRRVARELALRVLFQVDVGKQPLDEVLEGAAGQVVIAVAQPVGQAAKEGVAALRRLALERAAEASSQSSRQIKQVSTLMSAQIRALAENLNERAADAARRPREGAGGRAVEGMRSDLEDALKVLRRLAAREGTYREVLKELGTLAEERVDQIRFAFERHIDPAVSTSALIRRLVHGVLEKRKEIDRRIGALTAGWAQERQPAVDRNILRLAAYEILFVPDIPMSVSINEAVELARKYSTDESPRFVNGVLGALAAEARREQGLNEAAPAEVASAASDLTEMPDEVLSQDESMEEPEEPANPEESAEVDEADTADEAAQGEDEVGGADT